MSEPRVEYDIGCGGVICVALICLMILMLAGRVTL